MPKGQLIEVVRVATPVRLLKAAGMASGSEWHSIRQWIQCTVLRMLLLPDIAVQKQSTPCALHTVDPIQMLMPHSVNVELGQRPKMSEVLVPLGRSQLCSACWQ